MNQEADRKRASNLLRSSTASRLVGYILFGILFGVGGAFVIPWSHSVLLGVSWVLGGVLMFGGLWASNQTRLTTYGVSGISMSGLRLPRRVELAWHEIVQIEQSAHLLKVHGQGATLNIGLVAYRDPQEVVTFVRSKLPHLANGLNRAS